MLNYHHLIISFKKSTKNRKTHILFDGCKITTIRGITYKYKQCNDFDFYQECYFKKKESNGCPPVF